MPRLTSNALSPALLVAALLGATNAQASVSCTTNHDTLQVRLPPERYSVPRGNPGVRRFTPWIGTTSNSVFTCSADTRDTLGPSVRSSLVEVARYDEANVSYPVYATPLPGVGLVIGWSGSVAGRSTSQFQAVMPNFRPGFSSTASVDSPQELGMTLRTALVQYGTPTAGHLGLGELGQIGALDNQAPTNVAATLLAIGTPEVVLQSCSIGNVTVSLGEQRIGRIKAGEATQSFIVPLSNCPQNIGTLSYRLDAPGGVIDARRGLVKLDSSSTATGVGIAVRQGNGAPVPIGNAVRILDGVANGGVTLAAAYVETGGEAIKPGIANTTLQFSLLYE